MKQNLPPTAWSNAILGITPAISLLILMIVRSVVPLSWLHLLRNEPITMAVSLLVIIAMLLRERRIALWGLPAIGTVLMSISILLIDLLPPAASGQEMLFVIKTILALLCLVSAIAIGVYAARQWGASAVLVLVPFVTEIAYGVLDPTYGLLITAPQRYSPVGIALIDVLTLIPILILMPVWVLRAGSNASARTALLVLPAVSFLMMSWMKVLHDFALPNTGSYTIQAALTWTFTMGTFFAAFFWAVLAAGAGIFWLIGHIDKPTQPPETPSRLQAATAD